MLPDEFALISPSLSTAITVDVGTELPADVQAEAVAVTSDGPVPDILGLDRAALVRAGFSGAVGSALALPVASGPVLVAVGMGPAGTVTANVLRDAAAAFARAVPQDAILGADVAGANVEPAAATSAIVEGIVLARYSWTLASRPRREVPVTSISFVVGADDVAAAQVGARRGLVQARVGSVARDLAVCPAQTLTSEAFADFAVESAPAAGLEATVYGRAQLEELNCGGLLGVNRGSAREPRMVVLSYKPEGVATGKLALVGKGITFDSGGISLKPGDESHSQMKNDMTGAGDILAAMLGLRDLGCTAEVTGYLMITDNMPSATAMQLGDILTMHDGTTVEVLNTDAEGRLVMADALALAAESDVDAIIDIATLTGACMRALGLRYAGVMGTSSDLVAQVESAGEAADELVWEFPLVAAYRSELDSSVADLKNLGGANAGQITAGLFLKEFIGSKPWAHIDIAGTAQAPAEDRWIRRGPTGFGARLLAEVASSFAVPEA